MSHFRHSKQELNIRPTLSDQTLQYVRSLERKIRQLEMHADSSVTTNNNTINNNTNGNINDAPMINGRPEAVVRALQILEVREQIERDRSTTTTTSTTTTVSNGTLSDRTSTTTTAAAPTTATSSLSNGMVDGGASSVNDTNASADHMDDGEKALVREMCNVVWRKLEDSPNGSGLDWDASQWTFWNSYYFDVNYVQIVIVFIY